MDCKPKLLYAEDNRLTAKEMTEILEEEGYEVVTTYSGDEAWETFERISPDLVLLDFRMPGLNGLEVFERIRQVDAEIPVAHPEFVQRILRPVAEKRHRRLYPERSRYRRNLCPHRCRMATPCLRQN